jgi:hypothetical protein
MVPMPRILGGFATLRGVNAVYRTAPGWTFQSSVGNTELYTTTFYNSPLTFEQFGDVFELGRFWTPDDSVEFFHHGRGDNPSRFKIYPQQPQRADVNALAASHGFGKDFSLAASAAASTSQANYSGTTVSSDSADLVNASYHPGATDVQLEYHNFGPFYTPGSGIEALSDRAGTIASLLTPIGHATQMGVNWDREQTRSVSQTQTTSTAFVDTTFWHGTDARVEFSRDRELTQVADLTTGTAALHVGRGDVWHSFVLDGSIVSAHDYVDDRNSSTSRFGTMQYSFQQGVQAIGLGVTASEVTGVFPRTVVNESLTDGLEFGGHQRRIGVQMGLTSSNTRSRYSSGTISTDLTGSLTYRIVRGVTCGLKAERTLFDGPVPQLDTLAGGMRFMLVVEH